MHSKPLVAACAIGLVLAGGFAFARASTTLLVPVAAAVLVALTLVRFLTPSVARFANDVLEASARSLVENVSGLARGRVAVLAVLTLVGVWAGYRSTPHVEIDLGSGTTAGIAHRFGPLDREGDITFRLARAGATLDLRDFGSGSPWTIAIHASATGANTSGTSGVLVTTAGRNLVAEVTPNWARYELEVPASSTGWRSAHVLTFPGLGARTVLRIERVEIERGGSFPALRPLVVVLGATLLVSAALRSTVAGAIFAVFVVTALVREPVVTIPFLPTLFLGAIATLFLGAGARGFVDVTARRNFLPELSPLAVSIALGGFTLWFAALASPLYVGGHYGFHVDIAEEIWQGRFLHYYLPYPGSMLSRQPQWNHLIIPHSCLFHTLAAPFAALPRLWFHVVTKLVLASLLFGISLATALVATRIGSARAGAYAAFASVFVPTGFQLLGLGHLMTLFGTWASTLALGFIVVKIDELRERAVFGVVVGACLPLLCFLHGLASVRLAHARGRMRCVVCALSRAREAAFELDRRRLGRFVPALLHPLDASVRARLAPGAPVGLGVGYRDRRSRPRLLPTGKARVHVRLAPRPAHRARRAEPRARRAGRPPCTAGGAFSSSSARSTCSSISF